MAAAAAAAATAAAVAAAAAAESGVGSQGDPGNEIEEHGVRCCCAQYPRSSHRR